jgi:GDP-L-fucose synthase
VGYTGNIVWNTSKPDGTPRKLMDNGRIHQAGWTHKISLKEGIASVYEEFRQLQTSELRAK